MAFDSIKKVLSRVSPTQGLLLLSLALAVLGCSKKELLEALGETDTGVQRLVCDPDENTIAVDSKTLPSSSLLDNLGGSNTAKAVFTKILESVSEGDDNAYKYERVSKINHFIIGLMNSDTPIKGYSSADEATKGFQGHINTLLEEEGKPPIPVDGVLDDEDQAAIDLLRTSERGGDVGTPELLYQDLTDKQKVEYIKIIFEYNKSSRIRDEKGGLKIDVYSQLLQGLLQEQATVAEIPYPEAVRQFQEIVNCYIGTAGFATKGAVPAVVLENGKRDDRIIELLLFLQLHENAIMTEIDTQEGIDAYRDAQKKKRKGWLEGLRGADGDRAQGYETLRNPKGEYPGLQFNAAIRDVSYLEDIIEEHKYDPTSVKKRLSKELTDVTPRVKSHYPDDNLLRHMELSVNDTIDIQTKQVLEDIRQIRIIQHVTENYGEDEYASRREESKKSLKAKILGGDIDVLDKPHSEIRWSRVKKSGGFWKRLLGGGTTLCATTNAQDLGNIFEVNVNNYSPGHFQYLEEYDIDDKKVPQGQFYDDVPLDNGTPVKRTRISSSADKQIQRASFHPKVALGLPLGRVPDDALQAYANYLENYLYTMLDEQNAVVVPLLHSNTSGGHIFSIYLDAKDDSNLIVIDPYYGPEICSNIYDYIRMLNTKMQGNKPQEQCIIPYKFAFQKGEEGNQN